MIFSPSPGSAGNFTSDFPEPFPTWSPRLPTRQPLAREVVSQRKLAGENLSPLPRSRRRSGELESGHDDHIGAGQCAEQHVSADRVLDDSFRKVRVR